MSKNQPEVTISTSWYLLFTLWIIATAGTLISLFFSNVMQLPVCVLCWYQRIALYPLVVIIPLGLFPFDKNIIRYLAALITFGWATALFHVLLIAGIIPEKAQPCVKGIPCSEVNFSLFDIVTIPVMSLLTFSLLAMLLLLAYLQSPRKNNE